MDELIDLEWIVETTYDENVKENLKALLKENEKRIIKTLEIMQMFVQLDKKDEASKSLHLFMDEFLGDLHKDILEIFKKFFLKD